MGNLIKSGGEWISSVELENELIAHPKVRSATVIAVDHERWQERPLALVVPSDETVTAQEIRQYLETETDSPAWWLPDDVVLIDSIPQTSTGKYNKKELREEYTDYLAEP